MTKKPTKPTGSRIVRGKAAKIRKAAPTPANKTSKQDQVLVLLRRQYVATVLRRRPRGSHREDKNRYSGGLMAKGVKG